MSSGHRTAEGFWRNEPVNPVVFAIGITAALTPVYGFVGWFAFSAASIAGLPLYKESSSLFDVNDCWDVVSLTVGAVALVPILWYLSKYPEGRRSYNESYRTRQVDVETP